LDDAAICCFADDVVECGDEGMCGDSTDVSERESVPFLIKLVVRRSEKQIDLIKFLTEQGDSVRKVRPRRMLHPTMYGCFSSISHFLKHPSSRKPRSPHKHGQCLPCPDQTAVLNQPIEFSEVGNLLNKVHGFVASIGSLAEPNAHIGCPTEYVSHPHDLQTSLFDISLIDA
jgi:hypothetical protein